MPRACRASDPLLPNQLVKIGTLDVVHCDVVNSALRGAEIVHLDDIGMVEFRHDPSFAAKSLREGGSRCFGFIDDEHLHGNSSIQFLVTSLVHSPHAAPANQFLDLVTIEFLLKLLHGRDLAPCCTAEQETLGTQAAGGFGRGNLGSAFRTDLMGIFAHGSDEGMDGSFLSVFSTNPSEDYALSKRIRESLPQGA